MNGIMNGIAIDKIPFFIESGCPLSPHVCGDKGRMRSLVPLISSTEVTRTQIILKKNTMIVET